MEKLSPQESALGADTVLRGSLRVPSGFSSDKPLAAKPWGLCPLGFAASGWPLESPSEALTLPLSTVLAPSTFFFRGQFFHTASRIFNSCFQCGRAQVKCCLFGCMGSNRIRTERVGQTASVPTVQTCMTESADTGYLSSRLSPNPVGANTSLYRWLLSTITQDICPASVS